MLIPKKLHHIWVGPNDPPWQWMDTWRDEHPDWEYTLWNNERVLTRSWINQKHIDFFYSRKIWHGVADLVRYEVLLEQGGFMPGADSICLRPIDELFQDDEWECYSPYENERVRPGLVSPVHAAVPGAQFLRLVIGELLKTPTVGEPWKTTGNLFMAKMIAEHFEESRKFRIWPSHFLIPVHYTGQRYGGADLPFATHIWGTTKKLYHSANAQPGKS